MDRPPRRSGDMNEAIAERVPPLAGDIPSETFESLYQRTFPRVYA